MQVESINGTYVIGYTCVYTSVVITISAYAPAHIEEFVSGTAVSEGEKATPEMVSHSLLIALHAVNKW